ncbi:MULTISPECIES: alternative ribosome rescue aminoacyl-tRNA hydrolase ArfB [Rufibacter]|uniref:Ribosome-associated protein n=1 Tax=Rufibacter quisquiliarum TaxID=1549639 RepID=A0A839GSC7_9BACT|nr:MULTISPECIES: alternative ribosome rescue aminoacyl-tRNA hydrolase ArfB [Rufibacter]MBA9078405.1 ribosome-associated protein [Rufibacter quisquiliarum]
MLPDLSSELTFQTSRSSGPGGQNVNKVASRVEVWFSIANSELLTPDQKALLLEKLGPRLNKDGFLHLASQESRSQLDNKEGVVQKLYETLAQALRRPKPRKRTKPSKAAIERRLQSKQKQGQKKANRRGGMDF